MANQMIALQARSPQLPDPARQNAQMAQMINMMQQQKAAERQAAQASQAMTFAANEESRRAALQAPNLKKAGAEADAALLKYYMDYTKASATDISNARDPQDAIARGDRLKRMFPEPELNTAVDETLASMPQDPALFGAWRDATLRRTLDAEKQLERKYENLFDADGNLITVETSPVGAFSPKVTPGVITDLPSTAPPPSPYAPRTPTTPQTSAMGREPSAASDAPMTFGPDATRPLNAYQQEDLRNLEAELGMQDTPASFTRGGMGGAGAAQMTPDVMSRIVDSAFETGVMAQVDFDQLLASQPPQNKQALVDSFQRANITLQADAPSLADSAMGQQQPMDANPVQRPQSQFADLRGPAPQSQTAGLRGAPPMEQTLAQYQVGQQVKGRNPNLSPYPGSAQVPLGRLGAEKQVEAQATKDVELRMAPEIAKATKAAERAIELKSTATRAKYATEGILNEVADRINTIDELLRNPNRFSIVGAIEGNLPRLLQTGARADAQAAFDKIKNTATLTSLIDMRKSTETGASPVGANPTDKDAKIVEQAASKLIQTGEPATFDAELIDMRRKLYRTYQSAQREYDGVYGEVLKENPKLRLVAPKVSDRYISSKDLAKPRTSTKVDRNNPLLRD
jgi:hypothetical protein